MSYDQMTKEDFEAHGVSDWVWYYWLPTDWRHPFRSIRNLLSKDSRSLRRAIIRNGGRDPLALISYREIS